MRSLTSAWRGASSRGGRQGTASTWGGAWRSTSRSQTCLGRAWGRRSRGWGPSRRCRGRLFQRRQQTATVSPGGVAAQSQPWRRHCGVRVARRLRVEGAAAVRRSTRWRGTAAEVSTGECSVQAGRSCGLQCEGAEGGQQQACAVEGLIVGAGCGGVRVLVWCWCGCW